MRDLEKNKRTFWVARPLGTADVVDIDGNFTGETSMTYGVPFLIKIGARPTGGRVAYTNRGLEEEFDLELSSTSVILLSNDLIFVTEPTSNFDTEYDYMVKSINHSLNSYVYGLRARI